MNQKLRNQQTAAWCALLLVLPVVGAGCHWPRIVNVAGRAVYAGCPSCGATAEDGGCTCFPDPLCAGYQPTTWRELDTNCLKVKRHDLVEDAELIPPPDEDAEVTPELDVPLFPPAVPGVQPRRVPDPAPLFPPPLGDDPFPLENQTPLPVPGDAAPAPFPMPEQPATPQPRRENLDQLFPDTPQPPATPAPRTTPAPADLDNLFPHYQPHEYEEPGSLVKFAPAQTRMEEEAEFGERDSLEEDWPDVYHPGDGASFEDEYPPESFPVYEVQQQEFPPLTPAARQTPAGDTAVLRILRVLSTRNSD